MSLWLSRLNPEWILLEARSLTILPPAGPLQVVRSSLEEQGLQVRGVRLHGSAASHVLDPESGLGYKDLDLVFRVDLRSEASFQLTKEVVLACLLDFLPAGVSRAKITPLTLKEAYV